MGIILRVDDVGRTPEDTPERGTDKDLSYFLRWRKAAGLEGQPVVYGAVPLWINSYGKNFLRRLRGHELVAVHGWDHRRGANVTLPQMKRASAELGTSIYIPPFNVYSEATIRDWEQAGGKYFFGGIYPEHHFYGLPPCLVGEVYHLAVYKPLYGHADAMIEEFGRVRRAMEQDKFPDFPVVATLHVPWDRDFTQVRRLVDLIRPYLVPLPHVANWIAQTTAEER